ncbi:DUF192 domain-containing protein [Angustibacter sp. Root456]|uniref:DUF192 domain-containing protein n=1 Tax=Angustibacter sp. Root456 TaxID=1736539 RepID=UPI0006F4030C|nr:DUF192 domain-containing protein [Angustibacter sp. Root456]KQX65961.1 hypothetical protein ASD06_06060 [Angustibacter sp. Root456]
MPRLSPAARAGVAHRTREGAPARLVVDGRTTSLGVDVAGSVLERSRGLLGRRDVPTALLLHPCSSVHSLGMRVDLQVAYLDRDLIVLELADLPRWRVHLPRRRAAAVLEAAPGALTACGVRLGVRLALKAGRA